MVIQTRGQPAAVAAVRRMIEGDAPQAVLLVGPPSTGKTTLALDLAGGLLCTAEQPADRPCGICRGCRQVASGNHPDLHRLAPEGPGGQVRLGDPHHPEPGTVRHLIGELARLPVEGGARVAVIETAHRLNEDAQNALLKTLEEPPPGVTIVLCADDEDRLLPTVRSRCVRLRLGPVGIREIEELLGDRQAADPPTAARLARLAWGRPGVALAYAAAPEAAEIREELARTLLDLVGADRRTRLATARDMLARIAALASTLAKSGDAARPDKKRPSTSDGAESEPSIDAASSSRAAPAERRRAAQLLLEVWRGVARDLAVAAAGGRRELRDPSLTEELEAAAARIAAGSAGAFLGRLEEVEALLDQNANPELAIDVLVLAWPKVAESGPAAPSGRLGAAAPIARATGDR